MYIIVTTPPAVEPVSLAEFKAHARIDYDDEDALLSQKLAVARQAIERLCGIAMIQQTIKMVTDGFPAGFVALPRPPLIDVTSVAYLDTDRQSQALAPTDYVVRGVGDDGLIAPATCWPRTDGLPGSVEITYRAGYGTDPAAVPDELREAVLMVATHHYEVRDGLSVGERVYELPFGVVDLVTPFRRWAF